MELAPYILEVCIISEMLNVVCSDHPATHCLSNTLRKICTLTSYLMICARFVLWSILLLDLLMCPACMDDGPS